MPTTTNAHSGYFVLSSGSTSSYIVWVYFQQTTGLLRNSQASTAVETPYTINTWYHMEMRNINWTTHTYDWYVNGSLLGAGVAFYTAMNDITRLDLFNGTSSTAYWDEITFQ